MAKRWRAAQRATVGITLIFATGEWFRLVGPLFAYMLSTSSTPWSVIVEMVKWPRNKIYGDAYFEGYLLLATTIPAIIVLVGGLKLIISYIENSFVPISVLKSDYELTFDSEDLSVGRMTRTQLFHANRNSYQAYHLKFLIGAKKGRIPRESIRLKSTIGHNVITNGPPFISGSEKSLEVIERYNEPLPTSFIASIIPDNIVFFFHEQGWAFQDIVVCRRDEALHINEYNGEEAQFAITSLRYPVSNVVFRAVFPASAAPIEDSFKAFLVKENVADELYARPHRTGTTIIYEISVAHFYLASLKIYWKNNISENQVKRKNG